MCERNSFDKRTDCNVSAGQPFLQIYTPWVIGQDSQRTQTLNKVSLVSTIRLINLMIATSLASVFLFFHKTFNSNIQDKHVSIIFLNY